MNLEDRHVQKNIRKFGVGYGGRYAHTPLYSCMIFFRKRNRRKKENLLKLESVNVCLFYKKTKKKE